MIFRKFLSRYQGHLFGPTQISFVSHGGRNVRVSNPSLFSVLVPPPTHYPTVLELLDARFFLKDSPPFRDIGLSLALGRRRAKPEAGLPSCATPVTWSSLVHRLFSCLLHHPQPYLVYPPLRSLRFNVAGAHSTRRLLQIRSVFLKQELRYTLLLYR